MVSPRGCCHWHQHPIRARQEQALANEEAAWDPILVTSSSYALWCHAAALNTTVAREILEMNKHILIWNVFSPFEGVKREKPFIIQRIHALLVTSDLSHQWTSYREAKEFYRFLSSSCHDREGIFWDWLAFYLWTLYPHVLGLGFLSEANKINFNLKKLDSAGLRTILRPINLTSFT